MVSFGTGEEAAKQLKTAVHDETELTVSVGVASNRLVAKIASDLRKPDGLWFVPPGEEAEFLRPWPSNGCVVWVPRLGSSSRSSASRRSAAWRLCRRMSSSAALASTDATLSCVHAALARRLSAATMPRNRSVTRTHSTSIKCDWEVLEQTLLALSENVASRLRKSNVVTSTVSVKIRNTAFETSPSNAPQCPAH